MYRLSRVVMSVLRTTIFFNEDVRSIAISDTKVCKGVEFVSHGNGRKQFVFCLQAEIEIVEQYSDPRDSKSKAYVEPGAETSLPTIYSRANRNYCRPYTGKSFFLS